MTSNAIPNPSSFVAPTGRVKTYLENPELGTLPVSCTIDEPLFKTPQDRYNAIQYAYLALSRGAGVNIHLHNFLPYSELEGLSYSIPQMITSDLELYLDPSHPDYDPSIFIPCIESEKEQITVGDSLDSIFTAVWKTLELALEGQPALINLSLLRPSGTVNSKGMVASGAKSFAFIFQQAYELGKDWSIGKLLSFYSSINQEVRKGGVYKNGAITTSYPIHLPHLQDYLKADKDDHPWLKRGLVITADHTEILTQNTLSEILRQVNDGTLWLEKSMAQSFTDCFQYWLDSDNYLHEEAIRHNVCREILIRKGETCNITPANWGQLTSPLDIVPAYLETYEFLKAVHQANAVRDLPIYKTAEEDKQIGVSLVGLSNYLADQGISYALFAFVFGTVVNLKEVKSYIYSAARNQTGRVINWQNLRTKLYTEAFTRSEDPDKGFDRALETAINLIQAHILVAQKATQDGYKRVFTIAPGASVAFRYKDSYGYNLSPAFYPPFNLKEARESQTNDIILAEYPPDSEICSNVSYVDIFTIANAFQTLFNLTGKAHAISLDIWPNFDQHWFELWCKSDLTSTYYKQTINDQNVFDKSDPLMCEGCST